MNRLDYKSGNLNPKFRRVAKIVAGKIAAIDGVVGIVAVGGIGRGHSDEFSDLDLIVYAEDDIWREISRYIAVGQLNHKGIDFDIPVKSYASAMRRKVPSAYWSQELRWTLQSALILHDTGSRIARMISSKVIFPEVERKKLLDDNRHWADEILNYMYPTWKNRGRVHNLAHLLRTAAEHIILWIYARNGLFRPYMRKWPFYYLENDLVPEAQHFPLIKRAYMAPVTSMTEADRLRKDLFALCEKIHIGIEPIDWKDVVRKNTANWKNASDKTKLYLSW
jgi:hypothetical protein